MNEEAQALMDLNGGLYTIEHKKWLIWEGYSYWFPDAVDATTAENWNNLYNSIKDEPYAFSCE